ncbi:MAG: hypothetical protein AAF215_26215 [Cyanobacteria bacterium P01_A01_bin.123]
MSTDGLWYFYKVDNAHFKAVKRVFEKASKGMPSLPGIPTLSSYPNTLPVTQSYVDSWIENIFTGQDLSSSLYHEPFDILAYQLMEEGYPLSSKDIIEMCAQSRILPPAVLLVGIGSERFSKLPGHLGNILLHSTEIDNARTAVTQVLDIDWESYFERAKKILDYTGFDSRASSNLSEILNVIPAALERATAEDSGLLAITSWGCP